MHTYIYIFIHIHICIHTSHSYNNYTYLYKVYITIYTHIHYVQDEEVYTVIDQAMNGEIPTGSYVPVTPKCADSPPLSDDEYEHL